MLAFQIELQPDRPYPSEDPLRFRPGCQEGRQVRGERIFAHASRFGRAPETHGEVHRLRARGQAGFEDSQNVTG